MCFDFDFVVAYGRVGSREAAWTRAREERRDERRETLAAEAGGRRGGAIERERIVRDVCVGAAQRRAPVAPLQRQPFDVFGVRHESINETLPMTTATSSAKSRQRSYMSRLAARRAAIAKRSFSNSLPYA